MNSPSTEPNLLPTDHHGSEPGDQLFASLADLAASTAPTGDAFAYVSEVDGRYVWMDGDSSAADGWGTVDPAGGGEGRWQFVSDRLSISPLGGGADDWPRLIEAAKAAASLGIPLEMEAGTWTCASLHVLPDGLDLVMNEDVTVVSTLTPDQSNPTVAPFLTLPGTALFSTTVAAANEFGSDQVRASAQVEVGDIVRILDSVSATNVHGSTFTVTSVEATEDGAWLLTLDRPVQYQFGAGDRVDVLPAAPDIDIFGNGAVITGTGTRFIEFLAARDCVIDGLVLVATDGVEDYVASFDIAGYNNEFRNMTVMAAGYGFVGLALETQENSRIVNCEITGALGAGIMLFDNVDALILDSRVWDSANGLGVSGMNNLLGSLGTVIEGGAYFDNDGLGVGIHHGSRNTTLVGVEAYGNGTNLVVGDGSSHVGDTQVIGGSLRDAVGRAVTVWGGSTGTVFQHVDFSGSPAGLNVLSGADVDIDGQLGGAVASGVLVSGSVVRDFLSGTEAGDIIAGGRGNDVIAAGGGDDLLSGGLGADVIGGGAGTDTADYSGNFGKIWVDLATGQGKWNYAQGDTLTGIENVTGTEYNDVLAGASGANTLKGMGGNDTLDGGFGSDLLDGGAGNDTADYAGEYGGVWIDLATGIGRWNSAEVDTLISIENVIGTDFTDWLTGNGDDNRLASGKGDDRLIGGAGNDVLVGGMGADRLDGGGDVDTADYSGAYGGVWINFMTGVGKWNYAEGDTLAGIENVIGTRWNDTFESNGVTNIFTGGAGNDTFVFRPGFSEDIITDFDGKGAAGGDTIRFRTGIFTGYDDMIAHASQQGSDTVIQADPTNFLLLKNVQLADLHPSDFIFG